MRVVLKKHKLILLLMVLSLACIGVLPGFASEQDSLIIDELYLSVWPEYYTPDVVVNQTGIFVNQSQEPIAGEIWFQVPKAVEPTAVAEIQNGIQRHYFEVVDKGDHKLIRYELSSPLEPGAKLPLMLEYRYPRFQEAGHRSISVEFVSKYPVNTLMAEIKQPLRSTQLTLSPTSESKTIDTEGFDVYQYSYSNIKPEQSLEFQISYHKEDNLPSIDPSPVEAEAAQPEKQSMNSTSVIFLVLVFLALLGLTLFLALRSNSSSKADPGKGKGAKGGKKVASGGNSKKGPASKEKGSETKEPLDPKKKLRKMLVEGKINEQTYEKLLGELEKK